MWKLHLGWRTFFSSVPWRDPHQSCLFLLAELLVLLSHSSSSHMSSSVSSWKNKDRWFSVSSLRSACRHAADAAFSRGLVLALLLDAVLKNVTQETTLQVILAVADRKSLQEMPRKTYIKCLCRAFFSYGNPLTACSTKQWGAFGKQVWLPKVRSPKRDIKEKKLKKKKILVTFFQFNFLEFLGALLSGANHLLTRTF